MRQQFSSVNGLSPDVFTFQKSGSTNNFTPNFGYGCCPTSRASWKINNGLETVLIAGNSLSYSGFSADTNIRNIFIQGKKIENFPTEIFFTNDNIYGNLDLSSIKIQSSFTISNNPNLTGITHSTQQQIIQQYEASNCNLTGNLTIPSSYFYGEFDVSFNPNLTGITHDGNKILIEPITKYHAYYCNLTGLLDLSNLTNLGGNFQVSINPNLTGITHGPSSENFNIYYADSCDLAGNLDLTPLSGLGGELFVYSNPNLTGITFPNTSNSFVLIILDNNNLTGTLDLTPLSNLSGGISVELNPLLTDTILPTSNGDFSNTGLNFNGCDLNYVDMKPLSGASVYNSQISFSDNNMTTTDVNHILVDFSGNATYNSAGWSNIILDISGTNAAPDAVSGGYDGLAAITFLTNPPYNWTITHT